MDHTQILNLDLGDQNKVFKYFKWRQPPMEDDLKILKVEHLSNQLLDPTQILNLSLIFQNKINQPLYGLWLMRGILEECGSGWPTLVCLIQKNN